MSTIDPWLKQQAIEAAKRKIQLDGGPLLPIGQQMGPDGQPLPPGMEPTGGGPMAGTQQPAAIPGGAQRMDAPMIMGPQGGSEATMMAGV